MVRFLRLILELVLNNALLMVVVDIAWINEQDHHRQYCLCLMVCGCLQTVELCGNDWRDEMMECCVGAKDWRIVG